MQSYAQILYKRLFIDFFAHGKKMPIAKPKNRFSLIHFLYRLNIAL